MLQGVPCCCAVLWVPLWVLCCMCFGCRQAGESYRPRPTTAASAAAPSPARGSCDPRPCTCGRPAQVVPDAAPPVVRLMEMSKYLYEQVGG